MTPLTTVASPDTIQRSGPALDATQRAVGECYSRIIRESDSLQVKLEDVYSANLDQAKLLAGDPSENLLETLKINMHLQKEALSLFARLVNFTRNYAEGFKAGKVSDKPIEAINDIIHSLSSFILTPLTKTMGEVMEKFTS